MGIKNKLKKGGNAAIKLFKSKNVVPIYLRKDGNKMLDGKTALITGGASGIGFGIAKAFIEAGSKVIIAGRNEEKLSKACEKLGNNAKFAVLDVSKISIISDKIEEASKLFNPNGQIDILVNSAGTHGNQLFIDVTEDTFDSVIDINLKGTYFMCQKMGR